MKKYQVIYADPPWKHNARYRSKTCTRGPLHYPRMCNRDIANLPVGKIAALDSVLFLWVTDGHLDDGITVMKSWGFKYITVGFVWVKIFKSGKPVKIETPWFLKTTELCLFGTRGRPHKLLATRSTRSLVVEIRTTHSTKPESVRKRIESMFPITSKIELFARKKSPGWDVWGNEVDSDIAL